MSIANPNMLHATMPIKLHGAVILGPRFFLCIKSIEPFELACDQVLSAPSKKFLPLHYFIEESVACVFLLNGRMLSLPRVYSKS